MPSFIVVIPARYASTRLPGKPLLDIAGWPMIRHVWALARRSAAAEVIITADDARIVAAARGFGADACLSSTRHRSGTERIAALVTERGYAADTLIVNLQSDEPMMPPALLGQVAAALAARAHAQAATLCEPLPSAQADDPGMVKVVFDAAGRALYFSRAAIPWSGAAAVPTRHYRHLGLYAYRAGYLEELARLPPAPAERSESLEQLRILHHGGWLHVEPAAQAAGIGVDHPADLDRVRALLGVAHPPSSPAG